MSIGIIGRYIWNNPGNKGAKTIRLWRAFRWQLLKHTLHSTRVLRLANGVRFMAHPDCAISSALIYADWPEYDEIRFLRAQLRRGEVMVDVGANVGHLSLLLSDVVGVDNLFAFEPTPLTFHRLVENWQLNDWPTSSLFQLAVGANPGKIFVSDSDRPETKNRVGSAQLPGRSVEVPLIRLDDFRNRWPRRKVGLLKIDVEGYECEVFRGSQALLEEDRPRLIMFESLAGAVEVGIAAILQRARYEVFQLDTHGRPDFEKCSAQNLFAAPIESRAALVA